MPSPFTFSTTEPAANSNPGGVSRPAMQTNNVSTNDILAVDHVTFNNITGGQHKQVTYVNTSSPATPTSPTGIAFTTPGIADASAPQNSFINKNTTICMTVIRAFAAFTTIPQPYVGTQNITPYTQENITATIGQTTTGGSTRFVANLTANAVASDNAAVFITTSNANSFTYSFTFVGGVGTLTITLATSTPPVQEISFMIVQI